jgi:two-component system, sensor histidine kinase
MPLQANSWFTKRLKNGFKLSLGGVATLVAILFCLTLAPLLMLQHQLSQSKYIAAQNKVESVLWLVYQIEREHARMRAAWRDALEANATALSKPIAKALALQNLSLRYEIFVSRFGLIKDSPTLERFRQSPEYLVMFEKLQLFITQADPVVVNLMGPKLDWSAMRNLLAQANGDDEALRELSNHATTVVYNEIALRNITIKNQNNWIFALVCVQLLLMAGALIGLTLYARRQRLHNYQLLMLTRSLRSARSKALSASQAKSVFLANMSHELRTPFQGLLGMLNLLSETRLSGQQQDYVHTALVSARHLLGIFNDILDVSTVETGALKLRVSSVDLHLVVHEVQALMMIAAQEKNLNLTVEIDPQLPQWIQADATRLSQILFNLLNNAIKFTDVGDVSVRCALVQANAQTNHDCMQFSVQDTGIGMDSNTLKGLFSRFHQADLSIHRRYGGSGLGLEISRTLARLMGGTINVVSAPGKGSTFTLLLPLVPVQAPNTLNILQATPCQSMQVLVVDDLAINVKYLRILLEKLGHTVTSCENGLLAVELVRQTRFDLVLMDLHMPHMDGATATRAIRQLDGAAALTKVVMITADILNNAQQNALDAGANEFLAKPLLIDDLRQVLARCAGTSSIKSIKSNQPETATMSNPVIYIEAGIFADFVDLMPPSTVGLQLAALFEQPSQAVSALTSAIQSNDYSQAAHLAHQLKGTCMLMGFSALAATLAQIEATCLQNSADQAAPAQTPAEPHQTLVGLLTLLQQQQLQTHAALVQLQNTALAA